MGETTDETGELDGKERPNEGMPLSGDRPDGSEEPLFYYSRSRRLAKAPAKVRALYEESGKPKFSLVRPLLSTKTNAVMFATLAALVLISLALGVSGLGSGTQDYYGNRVSMTAVRYEGAAVVILTKTRSGAAYTGPLDIAVSPLEGAGPEEPGVYLYRLNFSPRSPEEFRFSIPFSGSRFLAEISHEGAGEGGGLAFRIKIK
ncbi:MAG: hypothetical protein LBO76_06505 [Treponema sp.]|nr:hypothetical protein [Treponema sp.]